MNFTYFSSAHRTFSRIDHILGHKSGLGKFKKIERMNCSSVTNLCLTLCYPMNCSTPGFPVLHYLPEFAQTYVCWISDAIHPSHPLSPTSPLAHSLSQHQGLFHWVIHCIRWPKYWSFSFSISPSNEYSGLISFRIDLILQSKGLLRVFSSTTVWKH